MAIEEFDGCIIPELDVILWRYMSLAKFESLLRDNALFFCRADKFSDPYEGTIPRREAEDRIKREKRRAEYSGKSFNYQKAVKNINDISILHKQLKKQTIINCWHINNVENDSMWQLYLKSNEGIAIKTSVNQLLETIIKAKEKIMVCTVRYLNYENDIWYHNKDYPFTSYNMLTPLIHKRIEFKQENELRLIHQIEETEYYENYWREQENKKGKNIRIDVENLVEEIYCAPSSDDNQIIRIKELIKKYGFKFEVKKSILSKEPYY